MKVVRKFDHEIKTKRTNKSISKGPSKKVLSIERIVAGAAVVVVEEVQATSGSASTLKEEQ